MNKYSTYVLYLLISVLVVTLYVNNFGPLHNMQRSVNDFLGRLTAPDGTRPNVVLVTIDGQAQDEYGEWPWNRDLLADLLAATASGEPKAILVDIDLSEDAYQDSAGFTTILAGQLGWIENVVLPYDIALSTYRSKKTSNPKHLFNYSLQIDNPLGLMDEESSLLVRKVFLPADKLLQNDPCLGFNYTMPDEDRTLRHQPLVMNYEGYYYPSLALAAATVYLNVPPDQVTVREDSEIRIGNERKIPINSHGDYYVSHFPTTSFVRYSAAEILGENFDYGRLKDKMVLVGVDDFTHSETFQTPVQKDAPELTIKASVVENIVNRNMVELKDERAALDMIILFAIGAVCAFVLPQVSLLYRFVILGCGLFILGNVNYFMVSSFRVVPQTVYVFLELVLFMIASPFLESILATREKADIKDGSKKKLPKLQKIPAQAPMAEEPVPVREIRASATDQENLETALIDTRDEAPFDHQAINIDAEPNETTASPEVAAMDGGSARSEPQAPPSTGVGPTIITPESISEEESLPVETASAKSSGEEAAPHTSQAMQVSDVKNLGRYQVTGILGKGAMGLVYKGIDPAINRLVALKTIRLDFVDDPNEMAELKERLYREAQAAGKLSHPNIVTIYDVGSEGHLQYIAMEHLEGQTLEDMIKKKVKFNYRIIAQVIMQICSALEYAHERGIVHRDIKPANLMILKDYQLKVMDYGIARVDSNSMTKTGIAMGTPNYISPEQLKGQAVDHRADLFSLGVVMYELLLGKRPFRGENITSLIYSIINHEPEKPSNVNPQIPLLFDRIVERALKKDPNERYQKAPEIRADLADFVEAFSSRG